MAEEKKFNIYGVVACIVAIILFVAVALGVFLTDVGGDSGGDSGGDGGGDNGGTDGSGFISLEFVENPSSGVRRVFESARDRWNDIITNNTITPSRVPANEPVCLEGNTVNPNQVFSNLRILVLVQEIDGVNGLLGLAGPCLLDNAGKFPLFGIMLFDSADLAQLEATGTLEAVILHEMGHVLGIGTLWPLSVQGEIDENASEDDALLQDPVLDVSPEGEVTVIDPNNQPKFVGLNARQQFGLVTGNDEPFVGVENGVQDGVEIFPSREDGAGSIDGHWDTDFTPGELMVFAIDISQGAPPLSAITIASLEDMGYLVDITKADPYSLSAAKEGNLRGDIDPSKRVELKSDIFPGIDYKNMKKADPAF